MGTLCGVKGIVLEHNPRRLKRAMGKSIKLALAKGILYLHQHVRPKHFQSGAERKYNYRPRTRAYKRRKMQKKGSRQPLVWSGKTRRMSALPMLPYGTARMMKGPMVVPWYINMVPKTRRAPVMGQEILTTLDSEAKAAGERVKKKLLEHQIGLRLREYVRL